MTDSIPSQKDRKYDRQLRLWAASGQRALEDASVCLLGSSPVATETMKNLILPNVGSYTVVDGGNVTEEDLSGNFFFDEESIGKSRAQSASLLLNELNQDSTGAFLDQKPSDIVGSNLAYFDQFSIVVASASAFDNYSDLETLSDYLYSHYIPLVVISTVGFYGYVRVVMKELPIIDTHPDSLVDLRLDSPWTELTEYVNNFPEPENAAARDHVPMVVLLLRTAGKWIKEHGRLPTKRDEKQAFKKQVEALRQGDSENVDEAVAAVWRLYQKSSQVPSQIQDLFDSSSEDGADRDPTFWALVEALKDFVAETGTFPLSGTIPDFKAYTKDYVDIQRVYKDKANKDLSRFKEIVATKVVEVPEAVVEEFCKNSRFIHLARGTSLTHDTSPESLAQITSEEDDLLKLYYVIRASQMFGGTQDAFSIMTKANELGVTADVAAYSQEVARYEGRQLHNIASVIGGVAAQEIVKILAKQYVPLNNTVLFDGIRSKMEKWHL
ncbi:NEDD8-activating enzyme E1 regulatory subunit [Yarrowia sp. B02]|nr:NEDD8-activating enzyme E1 regulatory subunit [Yarrowia sp. B02]